MVEYGIEHCIHLELASECCQSPLVQGRAVELVNFGSEAASLPPTLVQTAVEA